MTNVRIAYVTAPNAEVAEQLARSLVDKRLCACVNVLVGVRSFYRWEGQVCDDAELLLMVKTTADCVDALTQTVEDEHPYDVPEVIVVDVAGGSVPYLDWVRSATSST